MSPPPDARRSSVSTAPEPLRWTRTIARHVAANPWFDGAAMLALRRWFFPASRLWAAAHLAGGARERFAAAVPMAGRLEDRDRVLGALAAFEAARATSEAVSVEWERRLFGGAGDQADPKLAAIEAARTASSHAYYATRRNFAGLVTRSTPRARIEPVKPDALATVYGPGLESRSTFVAAPEVMPAIEVSRSIPSRHGRDYWLRFASPSDRLGDIVHARVHEPPGSDEAPTVVYGHGICVEFDQWRGLIDEAQALAEAGFRVIRPEAPWHGRRVPAGYYGGERIISSVPAGLLDALIGAAREWSVLADWARQTSRGPLGFAGSSLGALTAQLAASAANGWPDRSKPDAMLLITHTGDLAEVAMSGALASLFAGRDAARALGWADAQVRQYLGLLRPEPPPVVPAGRIVSVLGRRDAILPFAGGRELVEQWSLPQDNVFLLDRGHFSVPATLIRDRRPVERFMAIMRGLPLH